MNIRIKRYFEKNEANEKDQHMFWVYMKYYYQHSDKQCLRLLRASKYPQCVIGVSDTLWPK